MESILQNQRNESVTKFEAHVNVVSKKTWAACFME